MMAIRTRIYVEIKAKASRCFTDYPFVTKSESQFPDFVLMGTVVGPLPFLAAKGLSAAATEPRVGLVLETAGRAGDEERRPALRTEAPGRRVFGRASSDSAKVLTRREPILFNLT
jgi:hypothetical protein